MAEKTGHVLDRAQLNGQRLQTAERLAFDHGETYDSYLFLEDERHYFFSSEDRGFVSFAQWRRHVFVLGGLIAAAEDRPQLLREFMECVARNHWEVTFFNVVSADIPLFQDSGFELTKIGEEPLMDLQLATWRGKEFSWVRRQENHCIRERVHFREVQPEQSPQEYRDTIVPQLSEISDQHVRETVFGRELSLMVSRFDPYSLHRKRLFVAEREGRIEAFVIATPSAGGEVWATEMYRRRPDATRGVIPYLILQVSRTLKDEGVPFLSLCLVPGLHCQTRSDGNGLVKLYMRMWWSRLPWWYDPRRVYHFKSRFRPAYRECFVAAFPRCRMQSMAAFHLKWGGVVPDIRRRAETSCQPSGHLVAIAGPGRSDGRGLSSRRSALAAGPRSASGGSCQGGRRLIGTGCDRNQPGQVGDGTAGRRSSQESSCTSPGCLY